jgi:hypothetical protein
VVKRTFARLNRFRRLTIRYERRDDIHLAFTTSGLRPRPPQPEPQVLSGALKRLPYNLSSLRWRVTLLLALQEVRGCKAHLYEAKPSARAGLVSVAGQHERARRRRS